MHSLRLCWLCQQCVTNARVAWVGVLCPRLSHTLFPLFFLFLPALTQHQCPPWVKTPFKPFVLLSFLPFFSLLLFFVFALLFLPLLWSTPSLLSTHPSLLTTAVVVPHLSPPCSSHTSATICSARTHKPVPQTILHLLLLSFPSLSFPCSDGTFRPIIIIIIINPL